MIIFNILVEYLKTVFFARKFADFEDFKWNEIKNKLILYSLYLFHKFFWRENHYCGITGIARMGGMGVGGKFESKPQCY